MKRSSKPDDEEATHDDGIVQAEPIIVENPPKPDPKLLTTILKVINLKKKRQNFHPIIFYIYQ